MSPHDRLDTDPHRRAQRALAERHAGILETTESAWLDSHLAGCDECRAVAQSLAETTRATGGGRGHLPSRLISRWATESQTMPDVVRGYAIRHLRDCEQCREAFRIVGQPLPIEVASAARERVVIAARPGLVRRWFRRRRSRWIWKHPHHLRGAPQRRARRAIKARRTEAGKPRGGPRGRPPESSLPASPKRKSSGSRSRTPARKAVCSTVLKSCSGR